MTRITESEKTLQANYIAKNNELRICHNTIAQLEEQIRSDPKIVENERLVLKITELQSKIQEFQNTRVNRIDTSIDAQTIANLNEQYHQALDKIQLLETEYSNCKIGLKVATETVTSLTFNHAGLQSQFNSLRDDALQKEYVLKNAQAREHTETISNLEDQIRAFADK